MSLLSINRSARSAVAIVPPESVWEPIDRIRAKHDTQIVRWMPHVNLIFPFVHPDHLDAELERLAEACGRVSPLTLTLSRFRMFKHSSHRATIWLAPEPREPLDVLYEALVERYPHLDTSERFASGFTPHLSLGQTRTYAMGKKLIDELNDDWEPLRFEVDSMAVLSRTLRGPFRIAHRVALTGGR